ncbi:hypothetical protein UB46_25355 [Burkholderiaceae bacterium 16]|nr:hypothetical protein UB46_25355 [Burkholderiaceae bacterium 16]
MVAQRMGTGQALTRASVYRLQKDDQSEADEETAGAAAALARGATARGETVAALGAGARLAALATAWLPSAGTPEIRSSGPVVCRADQGFP